jgi:predicted CopG family antitoxin
MGKCALPHGAAQASYSDVFRELIKTEGRRNRRAAIWANKLATMRRTGESYSEVTCGSLSFGAQSRLAQRSR